MSLRPILVRAALTALALALAAPGIVIPSAFAQSNPSVTVDPATAAVGQTVTLHGSGWPAATALVAHLYEAGDVGGPGAALGVAFQADASGAFTTTGTVPLTLFGSGSRGSLTVVPGNYIVLVSQGAGAGSATAPLTVGPASNEATIWGQVVFDLNGNGVVDPADPPATMSGVATQGPASDSPPMRAITDARGRYLLTASTPGTYALSTQAMRDNAQWAASASVDATIGQGQRVDFLLRPVAQTPAPEVAHDERYFAETGYRVDDDALWAYFQARGGLDVFGYPVSRTFPFLGCPVQVFQRAIAQHCADQGVQLLNLLDPDLFPYTRVNGSTFPAADPALKALTPQPDDPGYATRILEFVAAEAPNVWQGQPVRFGETFAGLVTPEMAGTDSPTLRGLIGLELWGAPISRPLADPNNPHFVYQRFQRGIMHYDASTGATRGILLADYLKQILRNSAELPADLRAEAQGSRLFGQYCPGAAGWLCRPGDLPGTDLTFAFEQG